MILWKQNIAKKNSLNTGCSFLYTISWRGTVMGKWNEEAAPNNNMASEELEASNLVSNTRQEKTNEKNHASGGEAKLSPGNRRTV
jgi:hypothetical protein